MALCKEKTLFCLCLGWSSRIALVLSLGSGLTCSWIFFDDVWASVFFTLLSLRYTRFIVNCVAYIFYRPIPFKLDQPFYRQDVTVIIPTVDPRGHYFEASLRSILRNRPDAILVVTVGRRLRSECQAVLVSLRHEALGTRLGVSSVPHASKRRQIAHAIAQVQTEITILADDHIFWPSYDFLPAILAPFEDSYVRVVAPPKRVIRNTPGKVSWASVVNFIACNYFSRHNWEAVATNTIDNGMFVVSGRTAVFRTQILKDADLMTRFCNEKFFFGLLGGDGLNPDDDNFLTREALKKGWILRHQNTGACYIETHLGEWPKFAHQLVRWSRTTFRSNPVMLRDPMFLWTYMWTAVMVYWPTLLNFAIAWDIALFYTLYKTPAGGQISTMLIFVMWVWLTKLVKIFPHLWRYPEDLLLVFFQILFAYVHSFIKLWALLTFWDCSWAGRDLQALEDEASKDDDGGQFHYI